MQQPKSIPSNSLMNYSPIRENRWKNLNAINFLDEIFQSARIIKERKQSGKNIDTATRQKDDLVMSKQ